MPNEPAEEKTVTPGPAADSPAPPAQAPAQKTVPPAEGGMDRRRFLSWFGLAWLSFAAATTGALSIVLRFLFPNVIFEPPTSFKAGFPADYETGTVDERFKASRGIWIVREAAGFYCLSTVCTHLGCTPNWLSAEEKFKCPCHGSGFQKTGINFEGPAPRPLERYKITLAEDGQILIDKNTKFQEEKGQWALEGAYLPYVG